MSLQRAGNVTLRAAFPPTLPGRLCDWTVTSVIGELPDVDPAEYSQWFETLPERIETVSILNTLLFQHIAKVLVLAWFSGLWCHLRRRFPVHDWETAREQYMVDAAFAFAILLLAWNEWLKSCVAAVAYWVVLCGSQQEAIAVLLVCALAFNNRMVSGMGLSILYAVWAAMWKMPKKDPVSELPDWQRFLTTMLLKRIANLGPAGGPSYLELPEDEQQQKVNCLVCWSFDPLELPCHRQHTICIGCLDRFREEDNNCCPVCRLPLYKMQGDKRTSYTAIIACLCIFCAFNIIVIALKIYRGLFHHGPFDTLLFLPITGAMWLYFKSPRGVNERFLASWNAVTLKLWLTGLMLLAFMTGDWVGVWDQVTFVDGELVHGLCIGMEYQFVWDH